MADLTTLHDSIARTLWLSAYADAIEEARERVRQSDDDASHGLADALESLPSASGGEDWDDAVPPGFPPVCGELADKIMATMAERLPAAPLGSRWVAVHTAADRWMAETGRDEEHLGHCIALQALGHGVGIHDDAPHGVRFDALGAAIPHVECYAEVTDNGTVAITYAS